MKRFHFCLLISCLTSLTHGRAEWVRLSSSVEQVRLVELYTSEGCSSCPVADRWFSKLTEAEGLWKKMIPIALPVDYWDNLGWKDPYASKENTERQYALSSVWRSATVYTPCVVSNGMEARNWMKGLGEFKGKQMGVLKLSSTDQQSWIVKFEPGPDAPSVPLVAHVAWLGFDLSSKVTRGENRGSVLKHDFVAIKRAKIELKDFAGKVDLPKPSELQLGIVCWVEPKDRPIPIQAVGRRFNQ